MVMTKEEKLAKKRAYYNERKDDPEFKQRRHEIRRNFIEKNPDAARQYSSNFRKRNPERCADYARKYYLEHRDEVLARTKKWRNEHPDYVREYNKWYNIKRYSGAMDEKPKASKAKKPCLDKIKSLFKNPSEAEKHFKWLSEKAHKKKAR